MTAPARDRMFRGGPPTNRPSLSAAHLRGLRRARPALALLILAAVTCTLTACQHTTDPIPRGEPPAFSLIAERYNKQVEGLDRVWGQANVLVRYIDQAGERRFEQGEGFLTVIRPNKLALSIGKLGETLFWLGCDADRYWWFDLTQRPRVGFVGRHTGPGRDLPDNPAATIDPRHLLAVLNLLPIPPDDGNTSQQWSPDGRLIGVTTRLPSFSNAPDSALEPSAFQRLWLDPDSYRLRKLELYDDQRQLMLVADVDGQVTLFDPTDPVPPAMPERVRAGSLRANTVVQLSLGRMERAERRFTPEAFRFEDLAKALRVDEIIDLDRLALGRAREQLRRQLQQQPDAATPKGDRP